DPIPLVEVCPSPVIAQKAMTQEKAPSPGLGFVKLDFLIGTKWGSKPGGSKSPPSQEPEPAEETSLSERRIKTLPISPYSSKTWRENPPKVLIPKDRPWEGGYPRYRPVTTTRRKIHPSKQPPRNLFSGEQTENRLSDFPKT